MRPNDTSASSDFSAWPEPQTHGFSLTALAAAAPDFLLAAMYLVTWFSPTLLGDDMYLYLFTLMAMEFMAIHSGGFFMYLFLGGCHWIITVPAMLGLAAFYLFAGDAISDTIGQTWPLWAVVGLSLNRMKTILFTPRSDTRRRGLIVTEWALSFAAFLFVLILSIFPWPQLGLPDPVIAYDARGNEMVFDNPQFITAFGVLYFTAQGLLDLYRTRMMDRFQQWRQSPARGPFGRMVQFLFS